MSVGCYLNLLVISVCSQTCLNRQCKNGGVNWTFDIIRRMIMKAIHCNLCLVDLYIVNNGFGSIGGFGLSAVGGARSPHPAVPFQWLHPWHACECLDFVCIRTLISTYVNKFNLSALYRYVTTSLWDLQDLLTSSVLMLPNAEKTEDGHKAAQLPRRAMGSPMQV